MIKAKLLFPVALSAALILLSSCNSSPSPEPAGEPVSVSLQAITKLLDDQVEAWNAGDIDAFMEGYWKSDSLRFASGGNVRRGWDVTLERYLNTYPDRAAMGELAFVDLEMKRLSPQWATVFGRFKLKREAPLEDLTGLFTLMFEKRPEGWIIVSDHTSSE